MNKDQLLKALKKDLMNTVPILNSIGIGTTTFEKMLETMSADELAESLMSNNNISGGLHDLYDYERPDLTVESFVVSKNYQSLFRQETIDIAKARLNRFQNITDSSKKSSNKKTGFVLKSEKQNPDQYLEDIYSVLDEKKIITYDTSLADFKKFFSSNDILQITDIHVKFTLSPLKLSAFFTALFTYVFDEVEITRITNSQCIYYSSHTPLSDVNTLPRAKSRRKERDLKHGKDVYQELIYKYQKVLETIL